MRRKPVSNDSLYRDRIKSVKFDPVFIIGPHRSGTTILYKALMESGCFNVTTSYHVLRHDSLLHAHFAGTESQERDKLQELFDRKGLKDRKFDSMTISPDIPEEYCFALPRQGRRPMVRHNNRDAFVNFCKKVQFIQNADKPLLLKNPFDTINFAYLSEILPNAKFVINHRNPTDVISSQMNALRAIIREKNEYVALVMRRYRKIYESPIALFVARAIYGGDRSLLYWQTERFIKKNYDYIIENAARIEHRAIHVRYVDLCAHPNETIRDILDFVGVKESEPHDYGALIQPRKSTPAAEVARNRDRILERNRAYCSKFQV